MECFFYLVASDGLYSIFIVSCRGVVQLGGPDPWDNQVGPAKVGAGKSFLFTKGSCVVKIS